MKRLLALTAVRTNLSSLFYAYWFKRPGVYSVDIARISLGIMWLFILYRNALFLRPDYMATKSAGLYDPIGVLSWISSAGHPPAGWLAYTISLVALYSSITLVLGLFSRLSLWLSLLAFLFLCSMSYSFIQDWSHGFNVCLLAHMAFIFAPVGQKLSLDSLWRKFRGIKKPVQNGFWAVLCANWATALMFFNAFFYKLMGSGSLSLKWAASENMRNKLITRYTFLGEDFPNDLVEWIVNTEWAYRTIGYVNLLFQAMPFVAVFFIRKPVWRLIFGLFFIVEEIGLGVLMGLNDMQWYFLIVFFIDFDYFLAKLKWIKAPEKPLITKNSKVKATFIVVFLGVYISLAFGFLRVINDTNAYALKTYPFSEFRMYSDITITENGVRPRRILTQYTVETNGDLGIAKDLLERRIWRNFTGSYHYRDSTIVHCHLTNIWELIHENRLGYLTSEQLLAINKEAIVSISMGDAYFVYPAPGEEAKITIADYTFRGKMNADGVFTYTAPPPEPE